MYQFLENRRKYRTASPLLFLLLQASTICAASWALELGAEAHLMFPFAVLLQLGFYALLRPRELLPLPPFHLVFGTQSRKRTLVVSIQDPKTRRLVGRTQTRVVVDYPQQRESSGWRGPWTGRKAVDLLVRKLHRDLAPLGRSSEAGPLS